MPSKNRAVQKIPSLVTSNKTVFVRNLPPHTTDNELSDLFSQFGHVVKCFTVGKNRKQVNHESNEAAKFAFVTFSNEEELSQVISKKLVELKGNKLICLPAKRRVRQRISSKQRRNPDNPDNESEDTLGSNGTYSSSDSEEEKPAPNRKLNTQFRSLVVSGLPVIPDVSVSESVERYKHVIKRLTEHLIPGLESIEPLPQLDNTLLLTFSSKHLSRRALTLLEHLSWGEGELEVNLASLALLDVSAKHQKKSKLLIRNLSFKCSLEELRKSFEKFGKVIDVHIPQKPGTENRMLGFAFVTMGNVFEASAALHKTNGREIMGRKVAVDWALDKKTYLSQKQQQQQQQHNEDTAENLDTEQQGVSTSLSSEDYSSQSENEFINLDSELSSEDMDTTPTDKQNTKPKIRNNDSTDGKCLFLRNLPFSLDEEDLEEFFTDQFGSVHYAKLVTNRNTGMLTGNGFVRFTEESVAEDCLKQSEQGISVEGRTIEVMRAVTKEEADVFTESGKKKAKNKEDKRNFKMAGVGTLDPESEAFKELSKADQVKRMRAEAEKKEKLKNPNIFVSKDRLSVRNLPISMGDKELKVLCAKHAPKRSSVKAAKVMRDLNRLEKGIGRSKGFGFVAFSSHEAATSVLETLNNNPDVLPNRRRLIVEFSLENQRAIKVQVDRLSRSKSQLLKLEKEKDSNQGAREKEKSGGFKKKGFGKVVLGKKNKLHTPNSFNKGKPNQVRKEDTKVKTKSPVNNKSNKVDTQREQQIIPGKSKRSKPATTPSRRDKKRKIGERDEKQFEELVRQYQKKLFRAC